MKDPVFRAAAAADVEEAFFWYEGRRAGLGEEFLATVQAALEAIVGNPAAAATVHRDVRRALLKRFPYGIYYRLVDGGVVVVGCFHASRNPRKWRTRR